MPDGYDWDMGRLAQNMMLAAGSLGIGSCPVTFHREEDAKSVLGVPDDHGARFGITLGYPDPETERDKRAKHPLGGRKDLESILMRDRFG